MGNIADRWLQGAGAAKERVDSFVKTVQPGTESWGDELNEDQVRANVQRYIVPAIKAGRVDAIMPWVVRHAPPDVDPVKALGQLVKKYGG